MKTWNDRYSNKEYVYGKLANAFIKQELDKLPKGRILFPAEGEGRNAVYAAKRGWNVSAFDLSTVGKEKAESLAREVGCKIDYQISDVLDYKSESKFDCIAIGFMHLPSSIREAAHKDLLEQLKTGGMFIMEVFHKEQMPLKSGGPKDLDLLYDKESMASDFADMDIQVLEKTETILDEGHLHQGKAIVLRMIAIKR